MSIWDERHTFRISIWVARVREGKGERKGRVSTEGDVWAEEPSMELLAVLHTMHVVCCTGERRVKQVIDEKKPV